MLPPLIAIIFANIDDSGEGGGVEQACEELYTTAFPAKKGPPHWMNVVDKGGGGIDRLSRAVDTTVTPDKHYGK